MLPGAGVAAIVHRVSLAATRELAEVLGIDQLELLRANRDRPWMVESGVLAFESVRPGDVFRLPDGREAEVFMMGSASPSSLTTQFMSQVSAKLSASGPAVQQTIADKTGLNTTDTRVTQGAQSAATLLSNGYNPNSSSDNANLIHAIAGGCALFVPAGDIVAAALEALWTVGNQIACPVTNAFASIGLGTPCNAPPCRSTGNWTPAGLLSTYAQGLPAMPTGSFASLAVPALATYAANAANCKGGMPPDAIVDAVVAIWNETHAGPAVPYFIPPISELGGSITPNLLVVGAESGTTQAARAGKDPNAYFAFGPVSAIIADGHYQSNPPANLNVAQDWTPFVVAAPPAGTFSTGQSYSAPRIVMVNSGALLPAKKNLAFHLGPAPAPAPPAAAASLSTGAKVAVGVGVVALGGAGLWLGLGHELSVSAVQSGFGRLWQRIGL